MREAASPPVIRTLFIGVLFVLGVRAVVKSTHRLPPVRPGALARLFSELMAAFGPELFAQLRQAFAHAPAAGGLSLSEARRVLGLKREADRDRINAAYRELMRQHHPDQGGSADMASRINAARDTLLAALPA